MPVRQGHAGLERPLPNQTTMVSTMQTLSVSRGSDRQGVHNPACTDSRSSTGHVNKVASELVERSKPKCQSCVDFQCVRWF